MLIDHRCPKCQHPGYRRKEAESGRGSCECGCRCSASKPELLPTFDVAGRKVERLIKPGGKFGHGVDNGLGHAEGLGVRTCDCAGCLALYEDLTRLGPAAAPRSRPARPSPRALREWAAEAGIDCPPVGRVPARVVEAYAAAHSN